MSEGADNSAIPNIRDNSGGNILGDGEGENVGKEDRKRRVLRFLYETGGAFPPMVIYRNVRYRGADFQRRAIDNYLPELADEGLIKKVDPAEYENRRVVEIPIDEDGYYIITEDGRDAMQEV